MPETKDLAHFAGVRPALTPTREVNPVFFRHADLHYLTQALVLI